MELREWHGVAVPDEVWDGVAAIYRAAFPAAERMGEDVLRAGIETGGRRLWTLGGVDAFAIAQDLTTAPPWMFGSTCRMSPTAR